MDNQDHILDIDQIESNFEIEPQSIISLQKFIFLSLISFGTYQAWWVYKAWRFFGQKEKTDISAVGRTLLGIVYTHSLLKKILDYAKEKEYTNSYSPTFLFVGFIVCNLLSRLPVPYTLISILSFVFLIPAFNALNFAKLNSTEFDVQTPSSFSKRQIILIILGAAFWILYIIGSFADELLEV